MESSGGVYRAERNPLVEKKKKGFVGKPRFWSRKKAKGSNGIGRDVAPKRRRVSSDCVCVVSCWIPADFCVIVSLRV